MIFQSLYKVKHSVFFFQSYFSLVSLQFNSCRRCTKSQSPVHLSLFHCCQCDQSLTNADVVSFQVLAQERSFDDLNWFDSARKNLEERISSLELKGGSKAQDTNSMVGSSLARWKLWSQTSPIPLEIQKVCKNT